MELSNTQHTPRQQLEGEANGFRWSMQEVDVGGETIVTMNCTFRSKGLMQTISFSGSFETFEAAKHCGGKILTRLVEARENACTDWGMGH